MKAGETCVKEGPPRAPFPKKGSVLCLSRGVTPPPIHVCLSFQHLATIKEGGGGAIGRSIQKQCELSSQVWVISHIRMKENHQEKERAYFLEDMHDEWSVMAVEPVSYYLCLASSNCSLTLCARAVQNLSQLKDFPFAAMMHDYVVDEWGKEKDVGGGLSKHYHHSHADAWEQKL